MIYCEEIILKLQLEVKYSGLSKAEIARRLGVSCRTVSYYLQGAKMPSLDIFANLCQILDADPAEILCLKD